jgi:GNAT superfamily N-acetyltransferase
MLIRQATEGDLPAILRLYAQPTMDDGQVLALPAAVAIFRRMSSYPSYALYLAEEDARTAVGTFALLIVDNLAHGGAPSALVEDVCVDENRHRQGIGRAMMTRAMELARAHGCYKLVLSSNLARPAAHQFYQSLGFRQHGVSFHLDLA